MNTYAKSRTSTGLKVLLATLMGLASLAIGTLMGFVGNAKEGYSGLNRPTFTPPDVLFSVVWSVLYFIMGIAFYLLLASTPISREGRASRVASIVLFIAQFVVNVVWPIIFFRADMYLFSFIWLALLVALVVALIVVSFNVNKASAIMLIPYLVWLLFATYLTLMILVYN